MPRMFATPSRKPVVPGAKFVLDGWVNGTEAYRSPHSLSLSRDGILEIKRRKELVMFVSIPEDCEFIQVSDALCSCTPAGNEHHACVHEASKPNINVQPSL